MVNRVSGRRLAVEASVRMGTLAGIGEKGPRARGLLIDRIRLPSSGRIQIYQIPLICPLLIWPR
jgi:hypothetical protein